MPCSSSALPFIGVRLVYLSLCCTRTATFVIYFHWPFLSTFLPHLPFSDLSSHSPHIFLVFWNLLTSLSHLFGNLSSFILTMCPVRSALYSGYFPYPVVVTCTVRIITLCVLYLFLCHIHILKLIYNIICFIQLIM